MIGAWLLAWVATQGIFMSEVLRLLPWNVNTSYAIATIWVFIVTITAIIILPSYRKKSLPKSKLLWLYAIPLILLIFLPQHYALALNIWVYIPMIIITVFWQDYLTFGILQPALSKRLSLNGAAILTAVIFVLGHAIFFLNNVYDPQFILIALAGFTYAFSSRYAGNIYIANIIHISFYLI
jgi:membrane protease YdiL (CAAX protease family)